MSVGSKMKVLARSLEALDGGPRVVGREVEQRQGPCELLLPVGPVALALCSRKHIVLPACKIRVA